MAGTAPEPLISGFSAVGPLSDRRNRRGFLMISKPMETRGRRSGGMEMSTGTTIVRKFCTLQEAAERLDITAEQIESLLSKGMLHEFRDGPHRLLRTAEVGAIVAGRIRRLERQGQPLTQSTARPPSTPRDDSSASDRTRGVRLPRAPNAAPQTSRRDAARPRTAPAVRQRRDLGSRAPARRSAPAPSAKLPPLSDSLRASRGRTEPDTLPPRPSLSAREWFWIGLVQDSPVAIALLSGLVLLVLAAVVAGVCALTDALR